MDSDGLDGMLDGLADMLPDDPGAFAIGGERSDYRSFWQLASEIQEGFNSGVHYPTRELRAAAWERFNELRDEAGRRGRREHEALHQTSKECRDRIFSKCSGITYSPLTETLFFFDRTTVDQMKQWGRYLGEAMKMLSEYKHKMLGEHKQECFEHIQEVKDSHDLFWQQYHEAHNEKHQERQRKKQDIVARVETNLDKNRERLRSAASALERHRARAEDLRDKISEATSEKWEGIFETWLAEAEGKIDDIEKSIQTFQEWIEEDEQRLRDLD